MNCAYQSCADGGGTSKRYHADLYEGRICAVFCQYLGIGQYIARKKSLIGHLIRIVFKARRNTGCILDILTKDLNGNHTIWRCNQGRGCLIVGRVIQVERKGKLFCEDRDSGQIKSAIVDRVDKIRLRLVPFLS